VHQPEPDPAAIASKAEKLKEVGNNSFKRGQYGDAIDLYSKAIGITLHPYPIFLFLTRDPAQILSHQTSIPHGLRSGLHLAQALPPRPRRLPTRRLAPVATLDGRSGAPQNAPAPHAGADAGSALDAAHHACGGGGGAAPDRAAGDRCSCALWSSRHTCAVWMR
jgi:hypothetical protein